MKMNFNKWRFFPLLISLNFVFAGHFQLCECVNCHHPGERYGERAVHMEDVSCCGEEVSDVLSITHGCGCSHVNVEGIEFVFSSKYKPAGDGWGGSWSIAEEGTFVAGSKDYSAIYRLPDRSPPVNTVPVYLIFSRFIC